MRIALLVLLLTLTTNAYAQRSAAALGSISIDAIEMGGNITADTDNVYDIGEAGTRFNDGFFGGGLTCGNLQIEGATPLISTDTIDAADGKTLILTGGGANGTNRGARLQLSGNEVNSGLAFLQSGNAAGADVSIAATDQITLSATNGTTVNGGLSMNTGYLSGTASEALTSAGSTISDALDLTTQFNRVSTVASGTGVQLPDCAIGCFIAVYNRGANALLVYPPASDQAINALSDGAGFSMAATAQAVFFRAGANRWFSVS